MRNYWKTTLTLSSLIWWMSGGLAFAQASFSSTSNGTDGALDFSGTPSGTIIEFDPASYNPPYDSDGDNVFHFTTVTIPSGVQLRLRGPKLNNAPVYFLASGLIRIGGNIVLDGESGHSRVASPGWGPSVPGPGGFPGGAGTTTSNLIATAQDGYGPGAGTVLGTRNASHVGVYGNPYLLPLTGGSGGAGGVEGGGAGGGAILIASSTEIDLSSGGVYARGGASGTNSFARCGSGGSIRLLAPTVRFSGTVLAATCIRSLSEGVGRLRVEALNLLGTASTSGEYRATTLYPTVPLGLPSGTTAPQPKLYFSSVNNQPVPTVPQASFLAPDVTLSSTNQTNTFSVTVTAEHVPLNAGTTVTVFAFNETFGGLTPQTVTLVASPTPGQSTGTTSIQLHPGFTRLFAEAVW